MKIKVVKYVNKCSKCGEETISSHVLNDMECQNCGKVLGFDNWEVKEKEVELKKEYISHTMSVILNRLEVYVNMPFYLHKNHLFTIQNPELEEDFPMVEFPSQYLEEKNKEKINEWILNKYGDFLGKLI